MIDLQVAEPREQLPQSHEPYDKWVTPDGLLTTALFHRLDGHILLRFPGQVDFVIDPRGMTLKSHAAPGVSAEAVYTLYHNAILPMLDNHAGGLNLHGSAVVIGEHAVAFLGASRSGKTTLAGALAKLGNPFLTEDVVKLERAGDVYNLQPSLPILRLFDDSASYLLEQEQAQDSKAMAKNAFNARSSMPFCDKATPLSAIFLLGAGTSSNARTERLGQAQALAQLMQHAFILDCEDGTRLRGHFERLASLASSVACFKLDYPRRYKHLPAVRDAIVAAITLPGD